MASGSRSPPLWFLDTGGLRAIRGAGTPPHIPSWGDITAEGRAYAQLAFWIILFPGLFLAASVLAINPVGGGLRDLFHVRGCRNRAARASSALESPASARDDYGVVIDPRGLDLLDLRLLDRSRRPAQDGLGRARVAAAGGRLLPRWSAFPGAGRGRRGA